MMFVFPITVPANTAQSAPVVSTLQLVSGNIRSMQVVFPAGVNGLASIALNIGLYQIFPSNSEHAFTASGETIEWTEDYDLTNEPYEMTAYAWNLDMLFPHTLTVRVDLAPTQPQPDLAHEIAALLQQAGNPQQVAS